MKNMTRALSMMLTVTMALVCFTGCGNSDTAGKPAAGTAADAASSPAGSGEKVTLTYWGWDSNFYKPVMEAFKKERSNVEFEVTEVASGDYVTKLQQSLASGTNLPDILCSELNYRGQMLAIDMWEDLTKAPYNLKDDMFFEASLNVMKNPEGKIVCVDETVCPSAIAYKRDLAKEYLGSDDPDELSKRLSDLDSICKAAKQVREKSGGKAFLFASMGGVMEWLRGTNPVTLVNEAGAVDFSGKYKRVIENACLLRDAGAIDVLEQWSAQENAAYADSSHILFPAANWSLEFSIKPNAPKGSGNWGMFAPGGTGYSWGGTALGVNKDGANKETAWEFIRFCTMEDAGIKTMKEKCDYYTAYKKPYEDKNYTSKKDEYFGGQDIGAFLYQNLLPGIKTAKATKYDGVAYEVLVLVLNNVIADKSFTAEQALGQALEEMQNRLPDEKIV